MKFSVKVELRFSQFSLKGKFLFYLFLINIHTFKCLVVMFYNDENNDINRIINFRWNSC